MVKKIQDTDAVRVYGYIGDDGRHMWSVFEPNNGRKHTFTGDDQVLPLIIKYGLKEQKKNMKGGETK